jgi:hypothetical protein
MIIAKLHIKFDRGTANNQATDLGLESVPTTTAEGRIVRGLGTHFESKEAKTLYDVRTNEDGRIRTLFRRSFLGGPFEGTFILPRLGAGREMLEAMDPPVRADVAARVVEYDLAPTEAMPPAELTDWADRVKNQMTATPLGRGKDVSWASSEGGSDGLKILAGLASCPVLTEETRASLNRLIEEARGSKVDRFEFKRRLLDMEVAVEAAPVNPRRAPIIAEEGPVESVDETVRGGNVVPFRRFAT